jgi:triphosphoribosyl-dephospho-CoA synthase
MGRAAGRRLGETIFEAIQATRKVVETNTNLGIVLLLAPLAAVPRHQPLQSGVANVLNQTTVEDARLTYEAIRAANVGGLGAVSDQDVSGQPTVSLREAMALAQDRDMIASQYTTSYGALFDFGLPRLEQALASASCLEEAIVKTQLEWLANYPDSLIQRKRGNHEAVEASARAGRVLGLGWPETAAGRAAFGQLDSWLRAEGNARNPGTSADVVAACLFVALREGIMLLPPHLPWSRSLVHE